MMRQVQPFKAIKGLGDVLEAGHMDAPTAEDPDDGQRVGQGGGGLHELSALRLGLAHTETLLRS